MEKDLPIRDEEWEKLRKSAFQVQDFFKALDFFDSIRHIAGNSDFSVEVYQDMQKLRELAGHVFIDGNRECVGELFFESACMEDLMNDLEGWIFNLRRALTSLNGLRPESLPVPEHEITE